jgi:hypothetical protein
MYKMLINNDLYDYGIFIKTFQDLWTQSQKIKKIVYRLV